MNKYRDRLQIIADILSIVDAKARKTKIMYQANLSYRLLCRYLGEVVGAGLVRREDGDCYVLTVKGREFLGKHERYNERRKSLEEHLDLVTGERAVLEEMCFSMDRTGKGLRQAYRNKTSERERTRRVKLL